MDLWSPFLRDSTSTSSSPDDGAGQFQFTRSGMWVTALVLNSLSPTLEAPPLRKSTLIITRLMTRVMAVNVKCALVLC